jgi:hypothetical protein
MTDYDVLPDVGRPNKDSTFNTEKKFSLSSRPRTGRCGHRRGFHYTDQPAGLVTNQGEAVGDAALRGRCYKREGSASRIARELGKPSHGGRPHEEVARP